MKTTFFCSSLHSLIAGVLAQTGSSGQWNLSTISFRPQAQNLSSLNNDPASAFSFLIPYNESQSCDIYGALCQTGSITVGVSLSDSQTSTTTLPCSSYLTAQASFLNIPQIGFPDADFPFFPPAWLTGFGRSPQCRSYASVWLETGVYTFSGCGTNDATVSQQTSDLLSTFSEIPPGVLRHQAPGFWECCGNCSFEVQEVRLYYFPDENASAYCHSKGIPMIANNSSNSLGSSTKNASFVMAAADSLAVLSGQTFTSPSVYLEIVGTAAISDQCGPLGATLTNPWVAIPSGQLLTYSEDLQQSGACYDDAQGFGWMFEGTTKPLNVADLECPTFGLGPGTNTDGTPCRTIGPPYLPLIVPPSQVLSLDPGWLRSCTGLLSYAVGLSSFAIYDPPIALQPGSGLIAPGPDPGQTSPVTTQDPPSDPAASTQVQPAQIPSASLPRQTTSDDKSPSPTGNPQNLPPAADPPKPDAPAQTVVGSGPSLNGVPEGNAPASPQGLGGLIMGAFGPGPPIVQAPSNVVQPDAAAHATVLTVGDQTFTPSRGGFDIAGTPVLPGSAPIIIAGTPVSLNPSGEVFVGGSKVHVPQQDPKDAPPGTFTVGGEQFSPAATGFFIAGSQVLPASPPIYISGTPVSLGTSGILVIGSSSIDLLISQNPAPDAFVIGGETITVDPTGFPVHGFQILPGSPPVLFSGTPISLGTSAILVIGSSTIDLSGQTSAPNAFNVGGQTFTANPTGFMVAGSQILPGGSAVIIAGTTLSLSPSGVLGIGGASINLATLVPSADVINVGGQTFTANPSGFQIDGSSVLPDGIPITISGTQLSLDGSGELHVGTSSVDLVPFQTATPGVFTVDGLVFTAEPSSSAVAVDGVTLTPGGAPTTVGGERISLGVNGSLVVGSSTVAVPSSAEGGISTAQVFEGGQERLTARRQMGLLVGGLASGMIVLCV